MMKKHLQIQLAPSSSAPKSVRHGMTALVLAGSLWACDGGSEPNVPPQPANLPTYNTVPPVQPNTNPATAPVGPQVVAPAAPAAATGSKMNAQALASYNQGVAAFGNADLATAAAYFQRAFQADPRAPQAHYSLGSVYERQGKTSAALAAYQKSFGLAPEFELGMVAFAMLQAKTGGVKEADAFLTQKRGRMPKSANIAAALAEVKSLQKDTASAQRIAQEALKLDPKCAPAMMVIARDHYRNRRLDLALYALKAILDGFGDASPARDPNNAEAHLLRAYILTEQGLRVPANDAFKRVMALRPDVVVARLKVATFLLESGAAAEALPVLLLTLKYDNENIAAHLSLGDAYRLTGDYEKALQEFNYVKQRSPNAPEVHFNLGLLYLFAPKMNGMTERQKVEAAIASLNKFKELRRKTDPSDVDALLRRANLKKIELDALAAAKKASQAPPPPPPPPPATAAPSSAASAAPPAASAPPPAATP